MSAKGPLPPFWKKWLLGLGAAWVLWVAGTGFLLGQPLDLLVYVARVVWTGVGVALGLATYHTWALAGLRYTVNRDGVTVKWGWHAFTLPMKAIQTARLISPELPPIWWRWPAMYVGNVTVEGEQVMSFVTYPTTPLCLLSGPEVALLLSPEDARAFLKALERRRALGPTRDLPLGWVRSRWLSWPLWQDSPALLALAAVAIVGIVLWGEIARSAYQPRLLLVGQLATLLLAVNGLTGLAVYSRERLAALMLWWGSAGILFVLLVGLWMGALRL